MVYTNKYVHGFLFHILCVFCDQELLSQTCFDLNPRTDK